MNKYIKEGKDFSIETTLAGGNANRQMHKAKAMVYKITMFYVALSDVNQSSERVAMRTKNGGQDIPTEDIIRKSKTSFEHLYNNANMIDNLVLIIDNSKYDGEFVLEVNDGQITIEFKYHYGLILFGNNSNYNDFIRNKQFFYICS